MGLLNCELAENAFLRHFLSLLFSLQFFFFHSAGRWLIHFFCWSKFVLQGKPSGDGGGNLLGDGGDLLGDGGDLVGDGGDLLGDGCSFLDDGGDLLGGVGNLVGDSGNLVGDGGILFGDGGDLIGDGGDLFGDGGDLLGDGGDLLGEARSADQTMTLLQFRQQVLWIVSSNVKINDGLLFGANEELTHSEGVIVIEDTHRKVRPHWWDRPRASKPILLKITWTRCIRGILPWVHWFLNLPSTMLNVLNLF